MMRHGAFSRYLIVGAKNTLIGYGAILFFGEILGLSPFVANAFGYAIGLCVSYVLNRRYTFASDRSHRQGIPAFLLAAGACYMLNLIALALVRYLDPAAPTFIAQGVAMTVYAGSFFFVARAFVFQTRRTADD